MVAWEWISVFVVWNYAGFVILSIIATFTSLGKLRGFACFNHIWLYRNYKLNWAGAFLCALVLNLCCPIVTICYWTYKLCTVGRRYNDAQCKNVRR